MARAEQEFSGGEGKQRDEIAGGAGGGQELVDGWGRAGAWFKQKQACAAGGEHKLRLVVPRTRPVAMDGWERREARNRRGG